MWAGLDGLVLLGTLLHLPLPGHAISEAFVVWGAGNEVLGMGHSAYGQEIRVY